MKQVLCTIAIMVMVTAAASRNSFVAQDNPIKIIKPAINEQGWKILGLQESQIADPRRRLEKGYGPASVPLYVTLLKPGQKFITTIPIYRLKDGKALLVVERKVLIDGIIQCDVNGRTFMYILQCTIILEEPNGRTGYSGQFGVHYFDGDGDGKFESFEEGAPFVTPELRIPDWVLKNH